MEKQIEAPDLSHYIRLIETHRKMHDPIIAVRVEDLAVLIERYSGAAGEKPRVRRAATGVQA